jgi:hypothetical protein
MARVKPNTGASGAASPARPRIRKKTFPSLRAGYEALGVRGYYERHGAHYLNPHEPAVSRALAAAVEAWQPDLALGAGAIEGLDPFTAEAYQARTGQPAQALSFEAIAAGALAGRRYSLIVCSYALHLLEASRRPALAYTLCRLAPALLVLSPHKRPHLRPAWGWTLTGELVVERVRAKFFSSSPDLG